MNLLMVGTFSLLMMFVLMIAVWAERLLDKSDELVPVEERPQIDKLSP